MAKSKDKEHTLGLTARFIPVIGQTTIGRDTVRRLILMVIAMMATGQMTRRMDMERKLTNTVIILAIS